MSSLGGRPEKPPGERLFPVTSWIEGGILNLIYRRARMSRQSTSKYLRSLVRLGLESEGVLLQNNPENLGNSDR